MTKNGRLYGLIAVLAICIAIGIGLSVGTETQNEGVNCTISGRGIVSAEPNQVEIRLGVETEDKNVTKALEANSLGMNSTIEALKTLGISEDEIETSRFNIYPIRDYERTPVEIVGYRVTNEIAVKTGDLDKTGDIIRAAIDAGATKVRGIEFGLNETREKESKYAAMEEACEDAKGKAEAIARGFGLNIIRVVEIRESGVYVIPCRTGGEYDEYAMSMPATIPPPIEPGEIEVSATLSVTYKCG